LKPFVLVLVSPFRLRRGRFLLLWLLATRLASNFHRKRARGHQPGGCAEVTTTFVDVAEAASTLSSIAARISQLEVVPLSKNGGIRPLGKTHRETTTNPSCRKAATSVSRPKNRPENRSQALTGECSLSTPLQQGKCKATRQ